MKNIYTKFKLFLIVGGIVLLAPFHVYADSSLDNIDITELSLEELMDIKITSVSKKPEKIYDAAAAIFVITQDDIRRSGVTSIPEALRMVPGVDVARIDANKWAITSRGFNGRFANKLLVLIDGRSVYTPLFSGVYWDMQDTMLEDIERIEVIRGPGATLWGSNAVNGVINIITKHAKETQGVLVTTGAGTEEQGFGSVRYGKAVGDTSYVRAYIKYFNRDNAELDSDDDPNDEGDVIRGGFRLDRETSNANSWTVQGDIFEGNVGQTVTVASLSAPFTETIQEDAEIFGGNILTRWKHIFSKSSDMALQMHYDRTERSDSVFSEDRDTFDIDFQHHFFLTQQQEIVWGLGYRFTNDNIENSFAVTFDPNSRESNLYSAFIQDDIMLVTDLLRLTLGSKFEHNDYTGFEVQPSTRLLWTPSLRHTAWVSVSRSVRTPSRAENDIKIVDQVAPTGFPFPSLAFVNVYGNTDLESEKLLAYELGYRIRATDEIFIDVATFFNIYDDLVTLEVLNSSSIETSPAPAHLVIPAQADNKMDGETYGVELSIDWHPLDWWRFEAAYSYLKIQLHIDEDSTDTISENEEGESPLNKFSLRSSMELGKNVEFDVWFRYIDSLPGRNIDDYFTIDSRLGFHLSKNLEFSITGQNLLDSHHPEFGTPLFINTVPTEVERSIYGKLTWRF